MRVLIPGGSGFIGKYLLNELAGEHELYVLGTQANKVSVCTDEGQEIPYLYCDYSVEGMNNLISESTPDAVVNLAAHRPAAKQEHINDYYSNLFIAANIFQSCLDKNVSNLVNVSTRLVYSAKNSLPWLESDGVAPDNFYGLSKLWCEDTAQFFNQKGLCIKTLRLAQVIGLGEREGYVLQVYLDRARKGQPIVVYGKGQGRRHYIYAKDVARAIHSALLKPEISGIFNIGMADIHSFEELAVTINKTFGNKSEIIYDPGKAADENVYQMSIAKAKEELGWEPEYDLYRTYLDIKKDLMRADETLC